MIEPGRGWGYLVLFSEIGVSLLVTTLIGVLVGYCGRQAARDPSRVPHRRLLGRCRGRDPDDLQIDQPVPEDVRLAGPTTGGGGSERGVEPRSCVWSKRVERAGGDPRGRGGPSIAVPASDAGCPRAGSSHRRGHRLQHRRAHLRAAVPARRRAGRRVCLPGLLHRRHARVPGPARRLGAGGLDAAGRERAHRLLPEHQLDDPDDVDRHGDRPRRLDPDGSRLAARSLVAARTCSSGSTSS